MVKLYSGVLPVLPERGYFKKGDKGKQVKLLQKFLNWANAGSIVKKLKVDGQYGDNTCKAVKFFEQVHHLDQLDGEFGKKCLACAKKIKMTSGLKATNWAYSIINGGDYHYKKWKNEDKKTQQCPICRKLKGKYKGWNCIGFVTAAMHHGAKLRGFKCSCCGLGDNKFFEGVTAIKWRAHNGQGWDMISNHGEKGGESISSNKLKAGDVVICYDKHGKYKHTIMYAGDGKYVDCTSGRDAGTGEGSYATISNKYHATRAFRPH